MKIPISEIFESIQGEGRNTGKPSIFIRFWGCNLKCVWCDSEYSWNPSIEKATMMDIEEIADLIRSYASKHIIFTGGEPSLYQKQMKVIQELFPDYTYELETNGSKEITEDIVFEQVNISPKLLSSGNKEYEVNILKSRPNAKFIDFKFVCSNLKDTKETDEFLKKTNKEFINDIYIMPLGRDNISQVNNYLVKYCIVNNYRYCLRQHIILFGDGKGK